ncbi:MAG: TetR/AcrR family transcriptional regulator [Actinomycetota bacterium]|nr:TetR/AcrR family transcriptional regulator [Actinomycetota bacterium]
MARPGRRRGEALPPEGGATGERSEETRRKLVDATIGTLVADGFAGTTARAVATRAGCAQALVFYHFGSMNGLLLAALDAVSNQRRDTYEAVLARADTPVRLVEAAETVFRRDLDDGHTTVLAELLAGAASTPGLGAEVAVRLAPWTELARRALDAAFGGTGIEALVPTSELAHATVALLVGLELLGHLDGDRGPAEALFARAARLAPLLAALAGAQPSPGDGALAGAQPSPGDGALAGGQASPGGGEQS